MSVVNKTITVKSLTGKLGAPCQLLLAFVPDDVDFNTTIPIAWQAITLTDGGSSTWKWNSGPAAAHAVIDLNTGVVTTDAFTQVNGGQTTNLTVDTTKHPQEFKFSDATEYQGSRARANNMTGKWVDIGAGYITDAGVPLKEAVHPVIVLRRIADKAPGYVDYTPTLKIWATGDYVPGEVLDSSITDTPPLWEGTLTQIVGRQVTLTVSRDSSSSQIVVDGPASAGFVTDEGQATFLKQLSAGDSVYKYSVDLAFADPGLVVDGVRSIVNQLFSQGYQAKLTQKGSDTVALLELSLPPAVSCNKAELDTIAAIAANPTIFGKAYIKAHSGAALVSADGSLETWLEVNPASAQWFSATSNMGDSAAFNGTNGESFAEANGGGNEGGEVLSKAARRKANANANGNGNGSVYAGDDDAVPDDEAKFRSIRRAGRRALAA